MFHVKQYHRGDIMDLNTIFNDYMEAVEIERSMRHEIQKAVFDNPVYALEMGLIKISFGFPTPGYEYKKAVTKNIKKAIQGESR